jgi:hypothetical protein
MLLFVGSTPTDKPHQSPEPVDAKSVGIHDLKSLMFEQ